jgi:hypothetical protein
VWLALLALVPFAWSQEPSTPSTPEDEGACRPLEREAFRSLVVDSQSALDRGDLDLLLAILDEIDRDVPCLEFAPAPRLWADLMVVQAVAAFAQDGDWKRPLAAALRIRPGIDRSVGRAHPMYDWLPPPEDDGTPWTGEATLYVDGKESAALPPEDGWYLVQKTDGEYWETHWQRSEPPDPEWVALPVERPASLFWQVTGGGQFGTAHVVQRVTCADAFYDDPELPCNEVGEVFDSRFTTIGMPWDDPLYSRPVWGIVLKAKLVYGGFGAEIGGSTLWNFRPGIRDARFSGIFDRPRWTLGVGLSTSDVVLQTRRTRPDQDPVTDTTAYLERYYHVMGALRSDGPVRVEAMALVGFHSIIAYNGLADLSVTFEDVRVLGGRPQIGGQVSIAMGHFIDEQRQLRVMSTGLRITTHLTLQFGSTYR